MQCNFHRHFLLKSELEEAEIKTNDLVDRKAMEKFSDGFGRLLNKVRLVFAPNIF